MKTVYRLTAAVLMSTGVAVALLFPLIPPSYTLFYAAPTALCVGLPAYLVLSRFGRASYGIAALLGCIAAMLPVAYMAWPLDPGNRSTVHVQGILTIDNGTPTIAGWTNYLTSLLPFGVVGSLAALTFYRVARPSKTSEPPSRAGDP